MARIRASLGHNLRHLADFSGRDTPGQFWPWAIFLFLLSTAAGMLLIVPVLADMFLRMQRYLIEHPEGFPQPSEAAPAALPPELMPDLSVTMVPMAVVNLLFVSLLAAAVVRRLHDRDKAGLWALLPVPFMVYGQVQGSKAAAMMLGGGTPDPAVMLPAALNSLFYWIAVIALIVILVQPGTNGPNRFGPEPVPES
jgi:uncharacterized membrane protein YhaH (DUF805 family)